MSQTGLPAKRSGLILSCFSFLNPCRIPVWAKQNETFCLSHTLSSHRAKLIPCWAALPPAPILMGKYNLRSSQPSRRQLLKSKRQNKSRKQN